MSKSEKKFETKGFPKNEFSPLVMVTGLSGVQFGL